ncbi:SDR family oxidoreductase [Patescibacteria group bacterium]|nr:SDR family oxidoreductase [Patescibacteria group bacterium]MBU4162271.1 SDR family oxidoreductase [Patescibacteria group bacterium]
MKKTILIAGSGGYLGSEMVKDFLSKGYKIKALDRHFFGYKFGDIENKNIEVIQEDIRWIGEDFLRGVDVIINLAGLSNDPSVDLAPAASEDINYIGAVELAKKAKNVGVKKYIFSSSCSVYGQGDDTQLTEESKLRPVSLYAILKAKAEEEILSLSDDNFCVTSLRNSTLYGLSEHRMRFDLVVNLMTLNAWRDGKIFVLGGGEQWRPLMHLKDAINAFERVIEEDNLSKINKQTFNVGSNNQNYKIIQVANLVRNVLPNTKIESIPSDTDKRDYNVLFNKIRQILNFEPRFTVEDGIKEIVEALERKIIDGNDTRTNTVRYYKHLIDTDRVLSDVKLRGRIF